MSSNGAEIRYTISNLGLGAERALLGGIDETREFLSEIGATDGLDWTPLVRSRLYTEIRLQEALGDFTNTVGGVGLIGSMDQSFAPTVPEAIDRFRNRAGVMPWSERVRRLGSNIIEQRGLMPPVMRSLESVRRVAEIIDSDELFVNVYAEELPPGRRYRETDIPCTPCAQITPDLVEKLGISGIHELPEQLNSLGITQLSFGTYNGERHSQSGRTRLPAWEEYLPGFASRGLIRQVTVSLNREDLPEASGTNAKAGTYSLASELIKDNAVPSKLGALPGQIACILENQPLGQPLDVNVRGNVAKLRKEQLQNVFYNLGTLAIST